MADDPDFAEMTATLNDVDSAALIHNWLECAFWQGRDVRGVLMALGVAMDGDLALHNEKRVLAEDMLADTGSTSVNSEVLMRLLQ